MEQFINDAVARIIQGGSLTPEEAVRLADAEGSAVLDLFREACEMTDRPG